MEGNGLFKGAPQLGKIVLADDPSRQTHLRTAYGVYPLRVRHLSEGSHFLGNLHEDRIGCWPSVGAPTHPFSDCQKFTIFLAAKS